MGVALISRKVCISLGTIMVELNMVYFRHLDAEIESNGFVSGVFSESRPTTQSPSVRLCYAGLDSTLPSRR
jgi:hypothetical protein